MEGWLRLYNIALAAGATLLFLGVAATLLGGLLDLELDFDGDGGFDGPVPIHGACMAFGLVVFGAVGRLLLSRVVPGWALTLSLLFAAAGYWALARGLVAPMKRSRPLAWGTADMVGQRGRMKLAARKDFSGTVMLHSASGSLVSYSARPELGAEPIETGRWAQVVGFDVRHKTLIVRALTDKICREEEYGRNLDHSHHCGGGRTGRADPGALDMEEGAGG